MSKVIGIDPVEQAAEAVRAERQVVADLISKRTELVSKEQTLSDQRRTHAFRAHGQRDPKSQKALRDIHRQIAELASELASLDEAVDEGRKRQAAAEERHQHEIDRQKAIEGLGFVERLLRRGACHRQLSPAVLTNLQGIG
jgi:hypothetical protein